MINPERAILADRAALAFMKSLRARATHPSVIEACDADIKYLQGLIDTYEKSFFDLHGI